MGARGPHDEFETAKNTIIAAYATFNIDQDLEAIRARFISDDLEYVTRLGTFQGTDRYMSDIGAQAERWKLQAEVEEVLDAGEGAVIVLAKFSRIDRESGEVAWKAWPAAAMRIHDGKMVFFEGYIDRRKALAEYGLEQS